MVILNEGKNKIRDLIGGALNDGQVGTGSTSVTVSDTGLETPLAGTDNPLTITYGNKIVNTRYTLLSTEGNGNTLYEYVARFTTGEELARLVYPAFAKTSSEELQIVYSARIK